MLRNLFAIATNSFTETLRQPVYAVIIAAGVLLLVFGPSLSMFTIDDDNKLLKDVGLSTLLVAGLFLAVFASASVVHGEIENQTALTVITKTVQRHTFILGKFLGIAAAIILAQYLLSMVLLMIVRHGVMQTARDELDTVVITLGSLALGLTFVIGLAGNYFYRWRFPSTAVSVACVLGTVALAVMAFIDPEWTYNPAKNHLDWNLVGPIILLMIGTLILTAIAVAAATRLGLVLTLMISALFFVLGISLQPWLGPMTQKVGLAGYAAKTALTIFPCLNFYVVTNAIYEGTAVPLGYIGQTGLYALLYVGAVLLFTIVIFRRREIG